MFGVLGELLELLLFIVKYYVTEIVYFVCRSRPRKSFAGQSVLVTGGARGMGALYCWRFAAMGCTVHCVDVDEAATNALVGELTDAGHNAHAHICDVRDWDKLTDLKEIVEKDRPLDLLINNAGVYVGRLLVDLTPKHIAFVLDVNLLGQMYVTKQFLPGMLERGQGHIINITSIAGYLSATHGSDYAASKWGAIGFSECLQQELDGTNVQCTFVCPWLVRTPLFSGVHIKFPSILGVLEPETVVDAVILGAQENQERVFIPKYILNLMVISRAILPKTIFKAVNVFLGCNDVIPNDFTGRGFVNSEK